MTKVAVWCRHQGDNIIGIGPHIPWHITSDFKRFRRITHQQNLVAGETTYETFPDHTLPERKIYVLTLNPDYEVADTKNHFVVNDINFFKEFDQDLYISGGATIYKLFMQGTTALLPDIIVDCEYQGTLPTNLEGNPVDITPCVEVMKQKYRQVSKDYALDNIITRVLIRKGAFVEQSVLKRIIKAIEEDF